MRRSFPSSRPVVTAALLLGLAPLVVAGDPEIVEVAKQMKDFVERGRASGVVTLVAHEGKVVHHASCGLADVEAGRAMENDAIFAIASMTKPVTATALMILVDEGKVSLDALVTKYLPEFESVELEGEPVGKSCTVRHLLTHTSGIGGQQLTSATLAETVRKLTEQPWRFEPGAKWKYSPGLSVCGRIVEVVSKQPYERFLAKRIFEPLGMKDTTFVPNEEQRERVVKLYAPGEEPGEIVAVPDWIHGDGTGAPNPSGGLYSTAADLARFYQTVLNGGELDGVRIVSAKSAKEMTRVQTGDLVTGFTPGNGWGLGWCVVREPQGVSAALSPGSYGHGGAFGTQGWVDPKTNRVYVLLIQRTKFGNADGASIRKVFQDTAAAALEDE